MTTDVLAQVMEMAPHVGFDDGVACITTSRLTIGLRLADSGIQVTTIRGVNSVPHTTTVKAEDLIPFLGGVLVGSGVVDAPINRPHVRDGVYAAPRERWAIDFAVAHFRAELAKAEAAAATAHPTDGYSRRVAYEMRRRIDLAGVRP